MLTRLLDLLESGIGGVARPWQVSRVEVARVKARRLERLILEQTEKDITDIRAGRKRMDASGQLVDIDGPRPLLLEGPEKPEGAESTQPATSRPMSFMQAAQDMAVAREMQRAVNLKRVTLLAEEEADKIDREREANPQSQEHYGKVEADWLAKWRTGAEDVSHEDIQGLWARLLAGEVNQPGSYSLHTLDFLSRMSSFDAKLIERVGPYLVNDSIIKVGTEFFEEKGIKFNDLLYLDGLGLINGVTALGLKLNIHTEDQAGRVLGHVHCNSAALVFDLGQAGEAHKQLSFDAYSTTQVVSEILSLGSFEPDNDYLNAVAQAALDKGALKVMRGVMHPNGDRIHSLVTIAERKPAEDDSATGDD